MRFHSSTNRRAPLAASAAKVLYANPTLGQSIVDIARAYKRLGLLPESTDFAKALADYSRLERIFYYEVSRATIVMTPDSAQLARRMSGVPNPSLERVPTVLALARALQEQNFQWQGRLKRVSLEDRKLAFGALAAGDAFWWVCTTCADFSQPSHRRVRIPAWPHG